jgi:hypothetical protein
MSCDGADSFGYVTIEDDMVVVYTDDPKNPTVHKFCNDELIHAMKLLTEVKERFEGERKVYNDSESTPDMKEHAMTIATTLQGLLEKTEK